MKVMIVDKTAASFKVLGRMEAVVGMVSTGGNEIVSVNGQSCQVKIEGRSQKKTEVCIDIKTALEFGWTQNPDEDIQPTTKAKGALARNAESGTVSHRITPSSRCRQTRKRDAEFWRAKAAEKLRVAERDLRPFNARLNKSNLAEYDYRIRRGLEQTQWAEVLNTLARMCENNSLPPVLDGLTNDLQVRTLINWKPGNPYASEPRNMGPTIKTPEQLQEAAQEIQRITPPVGGDPNPDPRRGTKYDTRGGLTS